MTRHTLSVPDISCQHCKASIEQALDGVPGVERVGVSVADKTVEVEVRPGALPAVVDAIEEVGFPVAGVDAK